jgi:hypothetical protein
MKELNVHVMLQKEREDQTQSQEDAAPALCPPNSRRKQRVAFSPNVRVSIAALHSIVQQLLRSMSLPF